MNNQSESDSKVRAKFGLAKGNYFAFANPKKASKTQLLIFVGIFALICSYFIWRSFAAPVSVVKTWDTSADFNSASNSGLVISSDGKATLATISSQSTAPAISTQSSTPTTNLVPNPSFETDPNVDYGKHPQDSLNTYTWASDAAHSGSRSVKIVSTQASSSFSRWYSQTTKVKATAGKTYTAKAWIKTSNVTGNAYVAMNFWNSSVVHLGTTSSTTITGNNDWKLLTVQATAPSNSASVRIEFRLTGPGTIWADDAEVSEGASSTAEGNQASYLTSGTMILSLDSKATSNFTSATMVSMVPSGTSIKLEGRSSKDNITFTNWSSDITQLAAGQYLQLKLTLSTSISNSSPILDKVTVNYTYDDGTPSEMVITSSSVTNATTINSGTTWTVAINPIPESVEFWADGSKIVQDTTSPFATVLNLPSGNHNLGLCSNIGSTRKCFGAGGIYASITVSGGTANTTPTTPATQTGSLVNYEITITPNYLNSNDDPSSGYNALWIYPKSPTTPWVGPDSCKCQKRYMLLDPRYMDVNGRAGQDEWWMVIERYWPSSYDSANHGQWGRETNFHNTAGDAGPGGGVGWSFGDGVSSLALDWLPQHSYPSFNVEPQKTYTGDYNSPGKGHYPLPTPARNEWHTYVVHFIAGRTDGSTLRPGLLQVWVDGNSTPYIDAQNINTVQRAKGPDGVYYVQRWMTLWEGDYTAFIPVAATQRLTLTRLGKTLGEAIADRPSVSEILTDHYYDGSGTNLGPPKAVRLSDRDPNSSKIPSDLPR